MACGLEPVKGKDLSSLKVLGSVGEPINEEAWHWYNEHIGQIVAQLSILGGKPKQVAS